MKSLVQTKCVDSFTKTKLNVFISCYICEPVDEVVNCSRMKVLLIASLLNTTTALKTRK